MSSTKEYFITINAHVRAHSPDDAERKMRIVLTDAANNNMDFIEEIDIIEVEF